MKMEYEISFQCSTFALNYLSSVTTTTTKPLLSQTLFMTEHLYSAFGTWAKRIQHQQMEWRGLHQRSYRSLNLIWLLNATIFLNILISSAFVNHWIFYFIRLQISKWLCSSRAVWTTVSSCCSILSSWKWNIRCHFSAVLLLWLLYNTTGFTATMCVTTHIEGAEDWLN